MKVYIYQLSQMAHYTLFGKNYDFAKMHGGVCSYNYSLAGDLFVSADPPSDEELLESVSHIIRVSSYLGRNPYISDVFVIEKESGSEAYFCNDTGWINVTKEWFADSSVAAPDVQSTTGPELITPAWTRPVPTGREYVSKCSLYDIAEYAKTWDGEQRVVLEKNIEDMYADPNVVEVVFCKDCIGHGKCGMEDAFLSAGIEQPFCCGGNKKNEKEK